MKTFFYFFIVCYTLIACNQTIDAPPKLFLGLEKMKLILTEIHLSDAIAEQKANGNKQVEYSIAKQGFEQVLKNHSLSREQFDSNQLYYQHHPKLLNEIYTKMLTEMSKEQAELSR